MAETRPSAPKRTSKAPARHTSAAQVRKKGAPRTVGRPGQGMRRQGGQAPSTRPAGITRRIRHASNQHGSAKGGVHNDTHSIRLAVTAVAVFLVLIIAGIAGFIAHSNANSQVENPGANITLTIPDGATTDDIAKILKEEGVIANQNEFTDAVKRAGAGTSMKSGNYELVAGSDVEGIVKQLVDGPNSTADTVTIAEGLTVKKTASAVQNALGIPSDVFLEQAKASNYVKDYPFLEEAKDDSLEGFLYPKTYDFANTDKSADTVIRAMLDQYKEEVAGIEMSDAQKALKEKYYVTMSDYDIIKMASIIEKEALNDDDRYKIASVMYNRMKSGMPLQSDATLGYVTGGKVTADDLKTASPYNTYLYLGLTPTPICTPSLKSIDAALHPADTNYYYFWITEKEHDFSETYEQHQQAIADAQGSSDDSAQ